MKILSRNEKEKTTYVQIKGEASLSNIKGYFFDRIDPIHCAICNKKLYYDEVCIHSKNFNK